MIILFYNFTSPIETHLLFYSRTNCWHLDIQPFPQIVTPLSIKKKVSEYYLEVVLKYIVLTTYISVPI